jgi:hypothetical protein
MEMATKNGFFDIQRQKLSWSFYWVSFFILFLCYDIIYTNNLHFFCCSVFVDEMGVMCQIFDKAIDTNQMVDLHDMMYRFTLDSFVL